MTVALLEVEDLHAGYGGLPVLKGVDMTVEEGSVVCLIGPNGAGKSTLFRCVFGLLQPSRGNIRFRSQSLPGTPQRELLRMGISYLLQRDAVFKNMTVRENLEMGAFVADRGFDLDERIEEMFDVFPILRQRSGHRAGTLSGGERQMLEFARGLILKPELLMLDEPTAGLAPGVIDQIFDKIQEINRLGVTVLMIEQNIKTALEYADHAYVMEDGRSRLDGPADTVLRHPEIREAYLGRGPEP